MAEQTLVWWTVWLRLEDQMPNEPVIVYRVLTWAAVYDFEYTVDMKWWLAKDAAEYGVTSTEKPLGRSRWVELRGEALKLLSVEFFGQVRCLM